MCIKRKGDTTVPWGAPVLVTITLDATEGFNLIHGGLKVRCSMIQVIGDGQMFIFSSLSLKR